MVRIIIILLSLTLYAQDVSLIQSLRFNNVLPNGHDQFPNKDGRHLLSKDGWMYLMGGWGSNDDGQRLSNFIHISRDGRKWHRIIDHAAWDARHCGGHVVFRDSLWIISSEGFDDVWSSSNGLDWDLRASGVFGKRYSPYVAVFKDSLWLIGGEDFYPPDYSQENSLLYNDVWKSGDGITWVQVTDSASFEGRGTIQGYTVLNDTLYLISGSRLFPPYDDTTPNLDDVWKTGDGITWVQCTNSFEGKRWFSVATYKNVLWSIKGRDMPDLYGADIDDVWFSLDGANWYEFNNSGFGENSHANSIVVHNDKIFIVYGTVGSMQDQVFELRWSLLGINQLEESPQLTINGKENKLLYLEIK